MLRGILENVARHRAVAAANSNERKLGDFYATCMDSASAEAEGAKPLAPELRRIAAMHTPSDLQAQIARLQNEQVDVLFRFASRQDYLNSSQVIAAISQAGLGLPDRNDYLKSDAHAVKLRAAYVDHVARMLQLLGAPESAARAQAQQVMSIETKLARASMTRVARRNPDSVYHRMSVAQLETLTPGFAWTAYFDTVDAPPISAVNVSQPHFLSAANSMLTQVPMDAWKAYLRWHLADMAAPYLSSAFVNEDFHFSSLLSGAKELLPRWRRCLRTTDRQMGEALGKLYVDKTFTPAAKARALQMVHNLEAALRTGSPRSPG